MDNTKATTLMTRSTDQPTDRPVAVAVRTFYRASRVENVLDPPPDCDFDPYRDVKYAYLDTLVFDEAVAFAAGDYYECGHVEERTRDARFPSLSETLVAWEVYPDKTTRSYEP